MTTVLVASQLKGQFRFLYNKAVLSARKSNKLENNPFSILLLRICDELNDILFFKHLVIYLIKNTVSLDNATTQTEPTGR